MASKFEMNDLSRLTYYLGMEVCQHKEGKTLSQRCYALKILEEAGMTKCNSVHTPMEAGLKLSKVLEEKDIDATSYRKNVGRFRYLLHTRTDLSYYGGNEAVFKVFVRYHYTWTNIHEINFEGSKVNWL